MRVRAAIGYMTLSLFYSGVVGSFGKLCCYTMNVRKKTNSLTKCYYVLVMSFVVCDSAGCFRLLFSTVVSQTAGLQ